MKPFFSLSSGVKFLHLSSPLTHFFFIYSFIHSCTHTSNTWGVLLCVESNRCYLGAHILPLARLFVFPTSLGALPTLWHVPPSSGKESGRGRKSFEGSLSGLGFVSRCVCFFLLSNLTLITSSKKTQGSERLPSLPKVTQLEGSRPRLEASSDQDCALQLLYATCLHGSVSTLASATTRSHL